MTVFIISDLAALAKALAKATKDDPNIIVIDNNMDLRAESAIMSEPVCRYLIEKNAAEVPPPPPEFRCKDLPPSTKHGQRQDLRTKFDMNKERTLQKLQKAQVQSFKL